MKAIILMVCLCGLAAPLRAQKHEFEIREQKGTVEAILPGWNFAYSTIQIKTGNESWPYIFYANNAALFLSSFKAGDEIEFKAQIDLTARRSSQKMREMIMKYLRDRDKITEVKINGAWIEIHGEKIPNDVQSEWDIVLDQKVERDFSENKIRLAVQFENGTVAFNLLHSPELQKVKVGSTISCMGFGYPARPNFVYPIKDIKRLFTYFPLVKTSGTIQSFLHMQNYAYIGMVMKTRAGTVKLSFPANRAKEIKNAAEEGGEVTVFHSELSNLANMQINPIHVLIHQSDTLWFRAIYDGGVNGRHEFRPVTFTGKISRIERTKTGTMLSMLIDSEYYIELNGLLGQQLKDLLTKGREITIEGNEMIKLEGELYEKNYRIITPKKLIIGGKEFLTNF